MAIANLTLNDTVDGMVSNDYKERFLRSISNL